MNTRLIELVRQAMDSEVDEVFKQSPKGGPTPEKWQQICSLAESPDQLWLTTPSCPEADSAYRAAAARHGASPDRVAELNAELDAYEASDDFEAP